MASMLDDWTPKPPPQPDSPINVPTSRNHALTRRRLCLAHLDMSIYRDLSLPDDGISIRLLTIEPNVNSSSIISCKLHVAALQPGLQFEALSYCWGDVKEQEIVLVNSIQIAVSTSLSTALTALRQPETPRTLWVDALCINQSNLVEKAFQVPLMGKIYGSSSKTVIWLGESDEKSRKAFAILRKRPKEYPRILSSVLRRPWFRRIWIVQELALAQRATVQCGRDVVDWDDLAAVVDMISTLGTTINPRSEGGYKHLHPAFYPRILSAARRRIERGDRFGLLEALRSFQPFDSTLSLDKVYGITSLLEDPKIVRVDYELSPVDLYRRIALDLVRSSRRLDLFLDCLQNVQGSVTPTLPSWVPDWAATDQPLDNPIPTVGAKEHFQASCGTLLGDEIRITGEVLTLQGHQIGTIAELAAPIPTMSELRKGAWSEGHMFPRRRGFEVIPETCRVMDSWKATICRQSNGVTRTLDDLYFTGETLLEALYHTGQENGGPYPDIESYEEFMKWIRTFEFTVQMGINYGRIVSKLHWVIVWLITGPLTVILSFRFAYQLLRGRLQLDAPIMHGNPSRQSCTIGRMDNDLIGRFPAPGLSSENTLPSQVGDSVVIFRGGARPYVIRKQGECWRLIGDAYVHGIMYGAAFDEARCIDFQLV